MSPEAIGQRMEMVEALRKQCVSLKEAGDQARAEKAAREARKTDENSHS